MKDNEESIHSRVCIKAKKNNDLQSWIDYGCSKCKTKLKRAFKKWEEINEIARHADIWTEGSESIQHEKRDSMEIHDGLSHPLIGHMFMNEIIGREIAKIKKGEFKDMVFMFRNQKNKIISNVWSRF